MNQRYYHITIFLLINLFFLFISIAQPGQSPDIAKYLEIPTLEDIMMSPDGAWAFYALKSPDWESNTYQKSFYIISLKNLITTPLSNISKGRNFQFSPNGKYISFLRDEGIGTQLWVKAFPFGKAFLLNYSPTHIKVYEWGKKSLHIYFVNEHLDSLAVNPYAYYADEGANGRIQGTWDQLWEVTLSNKNLRRLTNTSLLIDELDISPNGDKIVFTAGPNRNIDQPHFIELYLLDLKTLQITPLTQNKVPEFTPIWSPDNRLIAFRATDDQTFQLSNGGFYIYDITQNITHRLYAQNLGKVDHIAWTPDAKHLIYNENQGLHTRPYKLDIETDKATPLLFPSTGTYKAHGFNASRTKLIYTYSNPSLPEELFYYDLSSSQTQKITNIQQQFLSNATLSKGQIFSWKSSDSKIIEGLFLPPINQAIDTLNHTSPLIVLLHGGPAENWQNKFYHDWQYWAAQGYAIFAPNIRGSSGYGDNFLQLLMRDIGGEEYNDLISGIEVLIQDGKVFADSVAIMGWSWGGVLGSWSITKTNRFKAAILGAPAVDWLAERGSGFTYDLEQWYIGKSSLEAPELWKKFSSINYIHNIQTPTLLVHGALDPIHSLHQSRILFHELRKMGVDTRLLIFPDQGHIINRPQELYNYYDAAREWLGRHLK